MGVNEYIQIGNRIKNFRQAKGLSQKDVAELMNVNRSTYSNYENGLREPNTKMISKIASALEVSPSDLMGWTGTYKESSSSNYTTDIGLVHYLCKSSDFNYEELKNKKEQVLFSHNQLSATFSKEELNSLEQDILLYIDYLIYKQSRKDT